MRLEQQDHNALGCAQLKLSQSWAPIYGGTRRNAVACGGERDLSRPSPKKAGHGTAGKGTSAPVDDAHLKQARDMKGCCVATSALRFRVNLR